MSDIEMSPEARAALNEYQRRRYAARKGVAEVKAGPVAAPPDDLITQMHRAYQRRQYARNPERHKESQRRYWEKKAREAAEAAQKQALGNVGNSDNKENGG